MLGFQSVDELARIADMVKANFMFQNLTAEQKQQIFQVRTSLADFSEYYYHYIIIIILLSLFIVIIIFNNSYI